jgi:hypothetical protein
VYYSPRPPPSETPHPTVETAPVRLDPSIDPMLADTQRLSVEGLEPPRWLLRSGPLDGSPTVLVPIVRRRRLRRRLGIAAVLAVAVCGFVLGVRFATRASEQPRSAGEAAPTVVPAARTASDALPVESPPIATPPSPSALPVATVAPAPISGLVPARDARPESVRPAAPVRAAARPARAPKAWIR